MPILFIVLAFAFPTVNFGVTREETCALRREAGFECFADQHPYQTHMEWCLTTEMPCNPDVNGPEYYLPHHDWESGLDRVKVRYVLHQ